MVERKGKEKDKKSTESNETPILLINTKYHLNKSVNMSHQVLRHETMQYAHVKTCPITCPNKINRSKCQAMSYKQQQWVNHTMVSRCIKTIPPSLSTPPQSSPLSQHIKITQLDPIREEKTGNPKCMVAARTVFKTVIHEGRRKNQKDK